MKRDWKRGAFVAAGLLLAGSFVAFVVGKYRTANLFFDGAFLLFLFAFLLRVLPSKVTGFLHKRGVARTLFLILLGAGLITGGSAAVQKWHRQTDLYSWLLHRKEQGWYVEIGQRPDGKKVPNAYLSRLLQNHLSDNKEGYLLRDVAPRFSRISWDFFEQLEFLNVKYVVLYLKSNGSKPVWVDQVPVAAAFSEALVFKVPKREHGISVLYSEKFCDGVSSPWGAEVRWMTASREKIYLHNHSKREVSVGIAAELVAWQPVEVELRQEGAKEILWRGMVSNQPASLSLENLTLRPGQNTFGIQVRQFPVEKPPLVNLLNQQLGLSVGVKSWKVVFRGMAPQEVAATLEREWPQSRSLERWLGSLPKDDTILEYPLAHESWKMPVDYAAISSEHARRDRNFHFDAAIPGFAADHFKNKPTPEMVWWADYLGIDYVVVYPSLYPHQPLLSKESGLALVTQFDEAEVYQLNPSRVRLECEHMPWEVGADLFDAAASGGMARAVSGKNRKERKRYLCFGPSAPLSPGRYRASFRLKIGAPGGNELLATVDACVERGEKILARREIASAEFSKPEQYQDFQIEFDLPRLQLVEFRVFYRGREIPLWADSILVEKIGGEAFS